MSLWSKNKLYRAPVRLGHRVSTPLRQWTVAMGAPMLFTKHAVTDSFRTVVEEGPFSILEAFGLKELSVKGRTIAPKLASRNAKKLQSNLAALDPKVRDEILYAKSKVHASEAQWLSGTRKVGYEASPIWKDGKLVDLEGSANSLIRITKGDGYKAYATGGRDAVETWLNTAEGRQFLGTSSWYEWTRDILVEKELPHTGLAVHKATVDHFLNTMVDKNWAMLDRQMPNVAPILKQMAQNDQPLSMEVVKDLIANSPNDNAVLSLPVHEWAGRGLVGEIVGAAMTPNKFNRDVVFDRVFNREYADMTKAGIAPDLAGRVAATVAELNVAGIHFDLANALTVEARHRAFAWFATKHELYATYIVKLAVERPQLAATIPVIRDWMEDRNAQKDVGEFDKHDLVLDIGGAQASLNLAPIMWFVEFPLNSSFGAAVERGAFALTNKATDTLGFKGMELHPSPVPFGWNATRADAMILTLADIVTTSYNIPNVGSKVETDAQLTEWLSGLAADKATRWNPLITAQRTVALARGEEITPVQAFNRAKAAAWKSELFKSFKFYSGKVYTDKLPEGVLGALPPEKLEIEQLLKDLTSQTDPAVASQMIKDNPLLAAAFNAGMDPVEKDQLDDGWIKAQAFADERDAQLEDAMMNNTLVNQYGKIMETYKSNIKTLTDPSYIGSTFNPTFAKYYGEMHPNEFIDALGLVCR